MHTVLPWLYPSGDRPSRHWVDVVDMDRKRLHKVLLSTYEQGAQDFAQILSMPGMGPKSLRALSLVSELIHPFTIPLALFFFS